MLSEYEVWVGTTYNDTNGNCGAQISHTTNGGASWTLEPVIRDICTIDNFSFIDYKNAYATASKSLYKYTILGFRII